MSSEIPKTPDEMALRTPSSTNPPEVRAMVSRLAALEALEEVDSDGE